MADALLLLAAYLFILWLMKIVMKLQHTEHRGEYDYPYKVKPWPISPAYVSGAKNQKQKLEKPMRCFICNYCPDVYPNNNLDASFVPTNHLIPYDKVRAICLNCFDIVDEATQDKIAHPPLEDVYDKHPLTGEKA